MSIAATNNGVVSLRMTEGKTILFTEVYYLPELPIHLLSCSCLDEKRITAVLLKGEDKLYDRHDKDRLLICEERREKDQPFVIQKKVIGTTESRLYTALKRFYPGTR